MRQSLAAARSSEPGTEAARTRAAAPKKPAAGQGPLVWKNLARQLAEVPPGDETGNLLAGMRLQQCLQEMTREELIAALDGIAALDVPAESRAMLELLVIEPLIQKDPELVLMRFSVWLPDARHRMAWQLASALKASHKFVRTVHEVLFEHWGRLDLDGALKTLEKTVSRLTGSAHALCWACSRAAATKPAKSGCGKLGLDWNSGWNCAPMKNG